MNNRIAFIFAAFCSFLCPSVTNAEFKYADAYMIESATQSSIVFKKVINNAFQVKNILLKSYPLLAYTATLPANKPNAVIVATTDDKNTIWTSDQALNIFGVASHRQIGFGVKSCNNSKIYLVDLKKMSDDKPKGQRIPLSSAERYFSSAQGYVEMGSPLGSGAHFGSIIEVHNERPDKLVIFAHIYDPVETAVDHYMGEVAKSLFGSNASKFKDASALASSLSGKELLKAPLREVEQRALRECEKQTNDSKLLCKNASDAMVKYWMMRLSLDAICESTL